ncbi:hypothetical protein K443DRAFT_14079 [Laccaria amethystina LaAM-08-1]|uniref:Unplaced genomic scaffold K443scaffold_429, whole genome shotgun sequence n=1 Tax=Laccaria amethystina LaAM-08-1 TaxID=1095629 RepID=A0A0C9WNB8_9AGAR|nr:hypothetical protein K443DRAFT_14079 [Laccaria amethystina LaAM-08-1]
MSPPGLYMPKSKSPSCFSTPTSAVDHPLFKRGPTAPLIALANIHQAHLVEARRKGAPDWFVTDLRDTAHSRGLVFCGRESDLTGKEKLKDFAG